MANISIQEMLEAGVHFGHLRRKWNPQMAPYIFMERNGIHIIDLNKTSAKLEEAAAAIKQIAKSGKKILFVATKKQAKDIVADVVKKTGMPYVTERWPGGMLTNFVTIRRAVRKMASIDKMTQDGTFKNLSKRERLQTERERAKLEKNLGSIADLSRLPSALFIVDVSKEHIAVAEAKKLNITTFAIVDTNSDPNCVDFAIPANDDASKSIEIIVSHICDAIMEGLSERKHDKDKASEEEKEGIAIMAEEDFDVDASDDDDIDDSDEDVVAMADDDEETTKAKPKKAPVKAKVIEDDDSAKEAEKKTTTRGKRPRTAATTKKVSNNPKK